MRTTLFTLVGVLFISSLSAQELSYFTGTWSTKYYQDNEEIKRKDFEELLKADTSSFELWQKHKKQSTLGSVFFLAELGSFVWLISEISNDGNIAGPTLATIGFGGLAIWIISKALNNKRDAVLGYNQKLDQKTSFKLEPAQNGLGIRVSF